MPSPVSAGPVVVSIKLTGTPVALATSTAADRSTPATFRLRWDSNVSTQEGDGTAGNFKLKITAATQVDFAFEDPAYRPIGIGFRFASAGPWPGDNFPLKEISFYPAGEPGLLSWLPGNQPRPGATVRFKDTYANRGGAGQCTWVFTLLFQAPDGTIAMVGGGLENQAT